MSSIQSRGKAQVLIHDSKGGKRKVMLENALYVQYYQSACSSGSPHEEHNMVSDWSAGTVIDLR